MGQNGGSDKPLRDGKSEIRIRKMGQETQVRGTGQRYRSDRQVRETDQREKTKNGSDRWARKIGHGDQLEKAFQSGIVRCMLTLSFRE